MLKRKCPNCSKKSSSVPVLSKKYICLDCVSIFYQPWWTKVLEVITASTLGTAAFFALLLYSNWIVVVVVLCVFPLVIDQVFRKFGPLKLGGVRGALHRRP